MKKRKPNTYIAAERGECIMLFYDEKDGTHVRVPMYRSPTAKKFTAIGVCFKTGTSSSDAEYEAIFPLRHDWKPTDEMKDTMRKVLK